jgi:hypothetical protein
MNILIYLVVFSIHSHNVFTFNTENNIDEWVLKIDGDTNFVSEFAKSNDLILIGNVTVVLFIY